MHKIYLSTGAVLAGLSVAIGAFGAHALKEILAATGRIDTYELAVRYQFYHSLALVLVGLLMGQIDTKPLRYSGLAFSLGIILFSGSLYVLSFTGRTILGAVTPFGGLFFILGWVFLIAGVYKK